MSLIRLGRNGKCKCEKRRDKNLAQNEGLLMMKIEKRDERTAVNMPTERDKIIRFSRMKGNEW